MNNGKLPEDVHRMIAAALFTAEGSTFGARCRVSLVSKTWKNTIEGTYGFTLCGFMPHSIYQ